MPEPRFAAQPGIAADRFVREILAILKFSYVARAAADGQAVRHMHARFGKRVGLSEHAAEKPVQS